MSDAPAAPAPDLVLAPERAPRHTGTFVHHDLVTPDPAAVGAFYGALVGWEVRPGVGADAAYTAVRAGGRRLGGIVGADPARGAPPHWRSYVAVDNVAAACARAAEAGGAVLRPASAMPDGLGTYAVLRDATGGPFAVAQLAAGAGEPAPADVAGGPWWHELLATDAEAAARFYAHVFGWEARVMMAAPDGTPYRTLHHAGQVVGGLMRAVSPLPYSVWQLYLTVDDVDAAVARATALGGALGWPAMDVPGVGRMAGLVDPAGAHFAVGRAAA